MRRSQEYGFSLRGFLIQARGNRRTLNLCNMERGESRSRTKASPAAQIPEEISEASNTISFITESNQEQISKGSISNVNGSISKLDKSSNISNNSQNNTQGIIICILCLGEMNKDMFYPLLSCGHLSCKQCLIQYLSIEISESRVNIACPQCLEAMHPSDIQGLLKDHTIMYNKYEDFMVRRVLAADPDTRWCPAPDCSYAVVATGCASCPLLMCGRPSCGSLFCYHCKAEWHPDQTCDAARQERQQCRMGSISISHDTQHRDDIKPCPRCRVLIVKMDDGSCNHMMCAVCGAEFCWLCMKEISDLHYLSPSGCTFWGKKPWSRKKKLLWQLGTLVGAPVGIALVAGIAVPAMIIGIPVWVGRKLHTRYRSAGKHKRNSAILGGVMASILVSPMLAGLAVAIGVPILLFYVYGVVPVSLCRAGGCGVSTSGTGVKFEFDEEQNESKNQDTTTADTASRTGTTSIGELSLSIAGTTQSDNVQDPTTALAGSTVCNRSDIQGDISSESASAITCLSEKSAQDAASTKALAGSIYKQQGETSDDCSERVRFDDTVSYIHCDPHDSTSPCSSKSLRNSEKSFRDETINNENVQHPTKRCTFSRPSPEERYQRKPISKTALLRNMFFHPNFSEDTNKH